MRLAAAVRKHAVSVKQLEKKRKKYPRNLLMRAGHLRYSLQMGKLTVLTDMIGSGLIVWV